MWRNLWKAEDRGTHNSDLPTPGKWQVSLCNHGAVLQTYIGDLGSRG